MKQLMPYWQGERRRLRGAVFLLVLLLLAGCGAAPADDTPQLLYYMSFQCPGCRQANPLLESLHQAAAGRYAIRALVFGGGKGDIPAQQRQAGLSFPMEPGSKTLAAEHAVRVTPTVILLLGGVARERYQGVSGVRRLQRVVEGGALGQEAGIMELARQPARWVGEPVTVRGQLAFSGAQATLGNGVETIGLAMAAAARPLGAELAGKELRVQGRLRLDNGGAAVVVLDRWDVAL